MGNGAKFLEDSFFMGESYFVRESFFIFGEAIFSGGGLSHEEVFQGGHILRARHL